MGTIGETAAAAWLEARGYQVEARNVRTRFGEIDLVVRQRDVIVFVEVKSRTSRRFGHPSEAIVSRKRRRLAHLASAYVRDGGFDRCAVRFDAVAVYLDAAGRVESIEHFPDAFRAEE